MKNIEEWLLGENRVVQITIEPGTVTGFTAAAIEPDRHGSGKNVAQGFGRSLYDALALLDVKLLP
jgi:hypothetical protein